MGRLGMKDTRQRIVEAGLKLFSEKGYLGATTKDIAKEAGTAEITLFRYFPSKEKLFEAVIRTYSFLPALRGLLEDARSLPYEDALVKVGKTFLDTLSKRRALIRIMFSEFPLYPSMAQKIYRDCLDEMFQTLASYFTELQAEGVLRRFDPAYGARAFLGMFFSFFTAQEFHLRKKLTDKELERLIREYVDIFVKGTVN